MSRLTYAVCVIGAIAAGAAAAVVPHLKMPSAATTSESLGLPAAGGMPGGPPASGGGL